MCEGDQAVAYYALASGAASLATTTGRFRRNMPEPIPVIVLGRLTVDHRRHGTGWPGAVCDSAMRMMNAAEGPII